MGKKIVRGPFLAPEEAACNLIKCFVSCHSVVCSCMVGKVGHVLKRKKNEWNKTADFSGSAVSILIICFETVHNDSNLVRWVQY